MSFLNQISPTNRVIHEILHSIRFQQSMARNQTDNIRLLRISFQVEWKGMFDFLYETLNRFNLVVRFSLFPSLFFFSSQTLKSKRRSKSAKSVPTIIKLIDESQISWAKYHLYFLPSSLRHATLAYTRHNSQWTVDEQPTVMNSWTNFECK